jgi:hypothetical protein
MYTDLFALITDVRAHMAATGRSVEMDDSPVERRFGFRDGGKTWHIGVTDVRRSSVGVTDPEKLKILDLIKTPEGRQTLGQPTPL